MNRACWYKCPICSEPYLIFARMMNHAETAHTPEQWFMLGVANAALRPTINSTYGKLGRHDANPG